MAEIEKIIAEYTEKGIEVTQETVEYLIWYCNRKMDVCGIENREEYLPLLFKDELKNYLFREYVNVTTLLRMRKGECEGCAAFV
ncbi:MAG: hypothetical protein HFH69_00640 [Lachnospiraceae bacterium]|nr:hypothetical protein [Lachnospiraceae bacterium]